MEKRLINQIYKGAVGKGSLVDLCIPENFNNKLIVFIHGFMGYKDWGCWNLFQDFYTSEGFGFCKYNVSHNGGTLENPIDFSDLEAFSKNNYSYELEDLQCVVNWLGKQFETLPEIYLIGHSRGGGIALLTASDSRIKKIVTLAAISNIEKRFPEGKQLEVWKTQGTKYVLNSRTNQKMPNSYSQYEDFIAHKDQLNIEQACLNSKVPTMVIHGDMDTSVDIEDGKEISTWLKTRLFEIEEAEHTFGATQPWIEKEMPEHLQKICAISHAFFHIDF